jgi:hypothetical protein
MLPGLDSIPAAAVLDRLSLLKYSDQPRIVAWQSLSLRNLILRAAVVGIWSLTGQNARVKRVCSDDEIDLRYGPRSRFRARVSRPVCSPPEDSCLR